MKVGRGEETDLSSVAAVQKAGALVPKPSGLSVTVS